MNKRAYSARRVEQLTSKAASEILSKPGSIPRLEVIQAAALFVHETRRLTGAAQLAFAKRAGLSVSTIKIWSARNLHQAAKH
jgi:hypothetical protein